MKCKNCAEVIAYESKFCNFCGAKVELPVPPPLTLNDSPKELVLLQREKMPKRQLILVYAILLIVALSVLISLGKYFLNPYFEYSEAASLMKNEKYTEASQAFLSLGSFKDSERMAIKTQYLQGKYLLDKGRYQDAIALLVEMEDYEDSINLITKANYQLGKDHMLAKRYPEAISAFSLTTNYEDSDALLIEVSYLEGKRQYNKYNTIESKMYFNKAKNHKDANEYLRKISTLEKFWGQWESTPRKDRLIFKDLNIGFVYSSGWSNIATVNIEGDDLSFLNTTYSISQETSKMTARTGDSVIEYTKTKENAELPKEEVVIEKPFPAIGMTKQEVKNSKWGTPKDINKTITKYGTNEQWVYSLSEYIYFEDGIVTAIQQ
ncbi:tetratricopeptide repeat protein [Paenibacillus sinopodophylli]|uniref:tetratricopeptide repeat protein n=1 Tax=Paenibacillus sinopodophylli TaxID=1837342 RepID=UPI00110CFB53|nr:tetratricopeptide repeat protein [Paenibacillus sinopodophylli]